MNDTSGFPAGFGKSIPVCERLGGLHTWRKRMPIRNLSLFVLWFSFLWLSLPCPSSLSQAQVPPITPSGLNTQVSEPIIVGGQTQYDITGGTRPNGGLNLFHSFGDFGVPTNSIANFQNTPVNGVLPATSNILGRVTGGNISNIFGTIQTTGFGNANLFLMNPTGFLFGPTATVNVGGMVAFTTADYLRLTDGGRFNAIPDAAADALISTVPVAAFGFLGPPHGGITLDGPQISFVDRQTVSLVGGDILINGGGVSGGIGSFNGVINVASVASAGEVVPSPGDLNVSSFSRLGTVTLTNNALLDVTDLEGTGAGTVRIRGGQLVMDGSSIQAVTHGDIDGAPVGIDIRIAGDAIIQNGSTVQSTTQGGLGRAGDVIVQADNLVVDSSGISAGSVGVDGAGGNLQIQTGDLTVTRGGVIDSSSVGPGQAGSVTIDATGAITVTGTGPGAPTFPSRISSSTQSPTRNAGPISITGDSLTLSEGGSIITTTAGIGRGGAVNIQTGSLMLSGGGQINTSSQQFFAGQSGPAGNVTISATGPVSISGQNSGIFSTTDGSGVGGNVTLQGQQVELSNSASMSAQSTGTGDAGNILINAGQNYTSTDSAVTTQATQASGGNITVLATDMVQLTNSQLNASVQGSSTTVGGNITIDPQYVILQNSQILARATQGQGGAISINITNGGLFLPDANSTVSASSQFGVNGTVTIQSPNAPASGKIIPLSQKPLIATALLSQRCAALTGGNFSSFTVAGRDSLPAEPSGWLSSPLPADTAGASPSARGEGASLQSLGSADGLETPIVSLRRLPQAGMGAQISPVQVTGCGS